MKQGKFILASLIMIVHFLASCTGEFIGIYGSGPISSETRALTDFDKIELNLDAEVELIQDNVFNVEVEDYENLLDHIHTFKRGETMVIQAKQVYSFLRNSRAKVYVSMPSLEGLSVSSSGKILILSGFDNLHNIHISGSGAVEAYEPFETSRLRIAISGSGSAVAQGTAEELNTDISGSGTIRLFNLAAQHASCATSGSGNTYVNVAKSLKATISGSGMIEYMGNPLIDANISGSGRIRSH